MRISCRPSGSTRYYISFKFLIPHESERSHQRIVLAPILLNVYLGVGWRLMEPQIPGGRDFGGRDYTPVRWGQKYGLFPIFQIFAIGRFI